MQHALDQIRWNADDLNTARLALLAARSGPPYAYQQDAINRTSHAVGYYEHRLLIRAAHLGVTLGPVRPVLNEG